MSGIERTLGAYILEAELGRGRFATVYRARDTLSERTLALKVVHPHLLAARGVLERVRKQVRALTSLNHPHIVTVHRVGEADGRLYVAMELIQGETMAQVLKGRGQGLSWAEMLALTQPLCAALDYAHREGLVHRDVRPANVMLDAERGPVLTDCGLVRLLADCGLNTKATGGVLGAPSYLAPEVWKTGTGHVPADLYALGCTVYELVMGHALFTGATPTLAMWAHDAGPRFAPGWLERVPTGAEAVLRRALARDPKERYRSALAFWRSLRGVESGAPADDEAEQADPVSRRRSEAEAAMARSDWEAARLAVGRWLTVAPGDPEARAAATAVQRQEESVERARQAAYWRSQAQALASLRDWVAVRMAVGRWLAVTPDDADALALQADLDARDAGSPAAQAQARAWEEAGKRARQHDSRNQPGKKSR